MVPVWGWGALLCIVLKAHHSPSQSLHRCSARSRGAEVIAQAFQLSARLQPGSRWPALWLTVIIPERRGEMKRRWKLKTGEMGWISLLSCWFVSTNAALHCEETSTLAVWSNVKVRPTLSSGWCNVDMTWIDSPWMIRDFWIPGSGCLLFQKGDLYAIWTLWGAALIPVAATSWAEEHTG